MTRPTLNCWVISDGRRGIENQALGLARALGQTRSLKIKTFSLNSGRVYKALPPKAQIALKKRPQEHGFSDPVKADETYIIIGCGRQAIAPLCALKSAHPDIYTIYIQDPRLDLDNFDLVIAPEHDGLMGPNIETMIGAPIGFTPEDLETQRKQFSDRLKTYPAPYAGLLIGGSSKTHRLTSTDCQTHLAHARSLIAAGYSLLVSTSRRTPDFARMAWARFKADHAERIWFYDGGTPNPYQAFLAAADILLVTQDSTNLLTEACSTGTPVLTLPVEVGILHHGRPHKFDHLYKRLETRCGLKPFTAPLAASALSAMSYAPLQETPRIAQKVWARFDTRATRALDL